MESGGLYYTGDDDTAQCLLCELQVSKWTVAMKPYYIHKERSPTCPFFHSTLTDERNAIASSEKTHTCQGMETMERMCQRNLFSEVNVMKSIRQRTFAHWPHQSSLPSALMVRAGFFKCDVGDRVICLYCNLICEAWIPNIDDPWEIHETVSPNCFFVKTRLREAETTNQEGKRRKIDHIRNRVVVIAL